DVFPQTFELALAFVFGMVFRLQAVPVEFALQPLDLATQVIAFALQLMPRVVLVGLLSGFPRAAWVPGRGALVAGPARRRRATGRALGAGWVLRQPGRSRAVRR